MSWYAWLLYCFFYIINLSRKTKAITLQPLKSHFLHPGASHFKAFSLFFEMHIKPFLTRIRCPQNLEFTCFVVKGKLSFQWAIFICTSFLNSMQAPNEYMEQRHIEKAFAQNSFSSSFSGNKNIRKIYISSKTIALCQLSIIRHAKLTWIYI